MVDHCIYCGNVNPRIVVAGGKAHKYCIDGKLSPTEQLRKKNQPAPKPKRAPKVPTKYMAFKEYCEWEGETWRFYVPIRGDHYANLCWLEGKLKNYGMSEFTVIQKELTEKEVDALCKDAKGGYMAFHNKMEGTIDLKELDKAGATKESLSEFLYKGGIENLFKKA